ncbi:MAG: hypothetical protein SFY70_09320 [Bacteroidia bacterium]|nr:hypothetical protein [Bacteroidia bacterium]
MTDAASALPHMYLSVIRETLPWYLDPYRLIRVIYIGLVLGGIFGLAAYELFGLFREGYVVGGTVLLVLGILIGILGVRSTRLALKSQIKCQRVYKLEVTHEEIVFYLRVGGTLVPLDYSPADFIRLQASFKPQNTWVRFYTKSGAAYSFSPRYWDSEHLKQDLKRLGLYR